MARQFRRWALGMAAAGLLASSASAIDITETFSGANFGGWSFGGGTESIVLTGGIFEGYWYCEGVEAVAPTIACDFNGDNPWIGDYRYRRIVRTRIDLRNYGDAELTGQAVSTLLISDNGTPADPSDDWGMRYFHDELQFPAPEDGWVHFAFVIAYGTNILPSGWIYEGYGENSPPAVTGDMWLTLMEDVAQLAFTVGNPYTDPLPYTWNIGVDNIAVTISICPEDLTFDEFIDFADLNIVISNFNQSGFGVEGDINGDSVVDFEDLNQLLGLYNTICDCGCTD